VIVVPVRNCEISLQRALQEIQTTSDTSRLAHLYQDAKNTLTSALMRGEVQPNTDAPRDLMSVMLYVHLAYRTKETDCTEALIILAAR
jgi:hypothetical protein